jgi:hypothetical protein
MSNLKMGQKALLILDNAPDHSNELMSHDGQISVVFLPPNFTPLLQPMQKMQSRQLNYIIARNYYFT